MIPQEQFQAEVEAHPPLQVSKIESLIDQLRAINASLKVATANLKAKEHPTYRPDSGGEKSGLL